MDFFQQMNEQARAWGEAQGKLWSQWLEQLQPGGSAGAGTEVWKQGVELWESAVRGVLDNQTASLEQWTGQITASSAAPEEMKRLTEQGSEMMARFIDIQRRMWDQWFDLLKSGRPFDPSQLTAEGAIASWRDMGEQMMKLQSDWIAAMSGGAFAGGSGRSEPKG